MSTGWTILKTLKGSKYLCQCRCGTVKEVNKWTVDTQQSTNCGCGRREALLKANTKHGMRHTKVYNTWKRMRQRCTNNKVERFDNYGGRGIAICKAWGSFENFYADMGDPPSERHSLDRIDVDKGYSKSNCRWATPSVQAANTTKRADNTTGYTGVFKNGSKWSAKLNWKKVTHHIGTFATPLEAAKARDKFILVNKLPHRLNIREDLDGQL